MSDEDKKLFDAAHSVALLMYEEELGAITVEYKSGVKFSCFFDFSRVPDKELFEE